MHFRSILRVAAAAASTSAAAAAGKQPLKPSFYLPELLISTVAKCSPISHFYSTKSKTKSKTKGKSKNKSNIKEKPSKKQSPPSKDDDPSSFSSSAAASNDIPDIDSDPEDLSNLLGTIPVFDKNLDVGPEGRPLFISTKSFSALGRKDVCSYVDFRLEDLNEVLPEGLPQGMMREFKDAKRCALLVRQSFLDLRDNFRRIVDPPTWTNNKAPKVKKQIVLDGPVSCGKSITLAMLVQWARGEGWLVFYVPQGRDWARGGFFYKQPETGLWDTPVQAAKVLQDFLKFNEDKLKQLPCQCYDPIPLGEGAGVGWRRDADSVAMPADSSLLDLIQTGLTYTHAAVGVLVRLRKELSMVKDVPVLIAIDQYNSWFTFSEYFEATTPRSLRQIHARELSTVNAFRSMMHDDMMVGAFSHSTAVGKLRKDLPDVPLDARTNLPRYSLDEAATVCHYYVRQKLIRRESFSEERWKKIYYLSNGNGSEMRWLCPFV